jgi:hypothetical protein
MGWEGSATEKERHWKAQPNPLNIQKAFTGAIIHTNIPTSLKRHGWKLLLIVAPKKSVFRSRKNLTDCAAPHVIFTIALQPWL